MKPARECMHIENAGIDFRNKISSINYYIDTLLNKTVTMFKYNNLPESIPERELELLLQIKGKCIIAKDNEGELRAFFGNYAPPLDTYYRSTEFLVTNPWAKIDKSFIISEHDGKEADCVLVRNDILDRGLIPILKRYGALLAETDLTLLLADENMRAIYAIVAGTDEERAAAFEFLKQIEEGRQGVLLSEEMSNGVSTQPYSSTSQGYITQIIELEQYIKGSMYQEIGLDCNYNMKRERLSESEAGLNADILRPLIDAMLEERQKAMDKVNEMFGTEITVEFGSTWAKYNPKSTDEILGEWAEIDEEGEIEQEFDNETEVETDTVENPIEEVVENPIEEVVEEVIEEVVEEIIEEVIDKPEDDEEKEEEEKDED